MPPAIANPEQQGTLQWQQQGRQCPVLEPQRRPVMAYADSLAVENVVSVQISSDTQVSHKILFDPGHGLEERLLREQFV